MRPITPALLLLTACLAFGCAETTEPGEVPSPDIQDTAPPADILAPTWPDGAALTISKTQSDRLTVSWPPATDDRGVLAYRVYRDDIPVTPVTGGQMATIVDMLQPATTYALSVRAEDAAGNLSEPLEADASTVDSQAPHWPASASLNVTDIGEESALLSWSPATDDVAVTAYRVMDGGTVLATLEDATQIPLTGLAPWTEYSLTMVAVDGADNASEFGPSADFQTLDETAPTWPEGAAIQTGDVAPTSVTLSWPQATDNAAVTGYRVIRDEVVVATTDEATTVPVGGLQPSQSVTFTVEAVDAAGNVSQTGPTATVNTTDESAPTWPNGAAIALSNIQPTSVTLAWPPADDDVAVTVYRVMQNGVEVAAVSDTKTNIGDLSSWSDYTFSVSAEDGAGNASLDTLGVELHTPDNQPPTWAESDALAVSDRTADSLTLSWPAATDDAAIAGYTLYQDEAMVAELGPETTTFDVTGLSPWTNYTYRVETADLAENPGTNSLTASTQTLDTSTPTWPAGLLTVSNTTPYSLTLAWTPAADDVAVTQYRITQNGAELETVDGTTTSLEVTELSPWTDYDFAVQAADAAGNWSESGPINSLKTPDTVDPTWPADADLTVSNLQSTSLELSWPAASDDVGIASYVITVDGDEAMTVDGALTSTTVSGLGPTETYLLTVVAVDPAGNTSTSLNKTETTPDGGPPTWPDGSLTAVNVAPFSLTLGWTPAVDDVGVTGYRLYQNGQLISEPLATELLVDGLEHSTAYDFKVEAGDAAGNWSTDGPELTVSTTELHDPGFQRMSREQFNRTLADLMEVQFKEMYCPKKPLVSEGCNSWLTHGSTWYSNLAIKEYGIWDDYRRLYIEDNVEPAPGELRGGYKRFDQVVHNEHVTSWIQAAMKVAQSHFEDNNWHSTSGVFFPGNWGDMGWGDRMVFAPCEKEYYADKCCVGQCMSKWGPCDTNVTTFKCARPAWMQPSSCTEAEYALCESTLIETEAEMYEDCVSDFITNFGQQAFRQPLTTAEHQHLLGVYQAVDQNYDPSEFTVHTLAPRFPCAPSPTFNRASRGLRNVMAVLLSSPKFIYRVELGDENGQLTAYELASRLSYHFWNSMPDTELFEAAADGSLMTEEGYQAQVERLTADPKSEPVIREFYRDYLRVEEHPDLRYQDSFGAGDKRYQLGANVGKTGHPTSTGWWPQYGIKEASQLELSNLGVWFTKTQPDTFEEMFRSNLHFLQCQVRSDGKCGLQGGAEVWGFYIYGVTGGECTDWDSCSANGWTLEVNSWDGVSEPITLPEPERAGLLTRIGFLAHSSMTARPIRRGLKIQEMLLCNPIPPPENCDVVKPPVLTGLCEGPDGSTGVSCSDDKMCGENETCVGWDKEVAMTVRQKVEEINEGPGTPSCAGCHTTFINGFGHALGHFSSEGRYWEKEHMFSPEKNGNGSFTYTIDAPENWPAIDAAGTSILDGQMVTVDGAHVLADALVDSGQMEWCWSREYFRFAMGRIESDLDAEAIEGLADSLRNGATLADGFKAIAHLPQFKALNKPIPLSYPEVQP